MRIHTFATILIFVIMLTWAVSCGSDSQSDQSEVIHQDSVAQAVDSTVHTIKVNSVGNLRATFKDLNPVHLESAMAIGIEPITDLRSAQSISVPVVKIESCKEYSLDTLTHSLPYLIPKAATLLAEIGQRFSDTIKARSGNEYKIRVTSVLRTEGSIAKLRRRNRNASDSSAHQYGTTFDISYIRFIQCNPNYRISQECLKNILGEVLFDLREKQRCFVKYEVKQGCFHITTR